MCSKGGLDSGASLPRIDSLSSTPTLPTHRLFKVFPLVSYCFSHTLRSSTVLTLSLSRPPFVLVPAAHRRRHRLPRPPNHRRTTHSQRTKTQTSTMQIFVKTLTGKSESLFSRSMLSDLCGWGPVADSWACALDKPSRSRSSRLTPSTMSRPRSKTRRASLRTSSA